MIAPLGRDNVVEEEVLDLKDTKSMSLELSGHPDSLSEHGEANCEEYWKMNHACCC